MNVKRKNKILLITNLYPESSASSALDATRALHNFVVFWSESADVMVIRPQLWQKHSMQPFWLCKLILRSMLNIIDGIRVYTLSYMNRPEKRIYEHENFFKLLKKVGFVPDIVITHRLSFSSIGDKLSAEFSVPHIAGVHNSCLKKSHLIRDVLMRTDCIACRSLSIKRHFLKKLPEFEDKIFVANSGIGKDKIVKKLDFTKKGKSKNHHTIKIISVCNLIPLKNIDVVLRALSKLPCSIRWQYTIIGDGPERKNLEKLAASLAIDGKFRFIGLVDNPRVYNYLDQSDVFVMISSPETFGLAYLEAMARGNVVIGTKGWGIDGVVVDGDNGYLCEEISTNILTQKIMAYMDLSPDECVNMMNNIYKTVNEYTDREMSQKYLKVIEQCIQAYHPE